MDCKRITLRQTGKFSDLFLDYLEGSNEALTAFYNYYPSLDSLKSQVEAKTNFPVQNRQVLVDVLQEQYQDVEAPEKVSANINHLLDRKTFTVTTGHQLNIFTGPLYFIFKIITVINTCRQLTEKYPKYHFVPVYWMASEDHDFDEIDHVFMEGKKYQWKTEQVGPVGRFSTQGIEHILNAVPGMPDFFVKAYQESGSLAQAGRSYVNHLFGEYGCIVVDGDDNRLKKLFSPIVEDDLISHSAEHLVATTSQKLDALGYKTQVFARQINHFYIQDGLRERIEKTGTSYEVLNTDIKFSKEEILQELHQHPERFSPNVILRPLYQETILPNIAYVGGPAEIAYWFQLKDLFDHFRLPFPLLMPRNFGAIISNKIQRKVQKTGLEWQDYFKEWQALERQITLAESKEKVLLTSEMEEVKQLFEKVKEQAATIDTTLVAHVEAQLAKTCNRMEGIEKKFVRAKKRHHADTIRQVEEVVEAIMPHGTLQERKENFLPFYLHDPKLIANLMRCFDPLSFDFYLMMQHGD